MKVAIVLNTSWNIYNFRLGLVRTLLQNGHEVFAIAPHDDYSHKLEELGCTYVPVRMDSRGINPFKDIALTLELLMIYRRIRPDINLHYTIKPNIYGTLASAILGIPSVNNVCGLGTAFLQKSLLSRIAVWLYRLSFRSSKMVFFQNEEDRQFFERKRIVKDYQSKVLPGSGIDPAHFVSEARAVEPSNRKFTFLLVSRLIHDKGILEYVDAIEILRKKNIDASFQLLGAMDTRHRRGIPEDLIQGWLDNDQVEYLGHVEDVKPVIEAADCVVLPSYREGTPRTLLEAASMNKPLIASDVPGCRNVVEDNKNGFLCQVKNSVDLADKMERMLSLSPEQRSEMGENSRKKIEQSFDEQIVIGSYLSAINTFSR